MEIGQKKAITATGRQTDGGTTVSISRPAAAANNLNFEDIKYRPKPILQPVRVRQLDPIRETTEVNFTL